MTADRRRVRGSLLDAARDRYAAADSARVGAAVSGTRVRAEYVGPADDGVRAMVRFSPQSEPVPIPAPPGAYVPGGLVWVSADERRKPVAVEAPVDEGPAESAPQVLMPRLASAQDIQARADLAAALEDLRELEVTLKDADEALADRLASVPTIHTDSRPPGAEDAAPAGALWWVVSGEPPAVTARWRRTDGGEWVAEQTSGDTIVSLDVAQLRASDLAVDSAAVARLWADVVVAKFLTATERIVTRDVIADGAVTARTLNVVSTDPATNTAMSLKPDGLRIFDTAQLDPETGDPTEAPRVSLVAGDIGLSFTDDAGEVAASVSAGGVTGKTGSFSERLEYRGTELDQLLLRLPQGILARGTMAGSALAVSAGTPTGLVSLTWQVPEWFSGPLRDRTFRLSGNLTASHGTTLSEIRLRVHKSAGSAVTTANSHMGVVFLGKPQDSGYHERSWSTVFTTGTEFGADVKPGSTLNLLVSVEPVGSGMDVRVDMGNTWMTLEDLGPATDATQTSVAAPTVSTGVAPRTERTLVLPSTGFTSYRNMTSLFTANPGGSHPIQGRSPYATSNGVTGAHIFFDNAVIRSALSGASVKSVEVLLTADHTHYRSGGTLGLWTHGYSSSPGQVGTMAYIGAADFTEGQSRWLGLPTTGWGNGDRRGVGIYPPGGSADPRFYLYLASSARLRITYLK